MCKDQVSKIVPVCRLVLYILSSSTAHIGYVYTAFMMESLLYALKFICTVMSTD